MGMADSLKWVADALQGSSMGLVALPLAFLIGTSLALIAFGLVAGFVGQTAQALLGRYWKLFAGVLAVILGLAALQLFPVRLPPFTGQPMAHPGVRGMLGAVMVGLLMGGGRDPNRRRGCRFHVDVGESHASHQVEHFLLDDLQRHRTGAERCGPDDAHRGRHFPGSGLCHGGLQLDASAVVETTHGGVKGTVGEMTNRKLKVLFLCTGNSCRSQMAEGWARHLKGNVIETYSAGIETHGLNSHAIKVMAEAGVDISHQRSKHVDELKGLAFDYVVTVCDHAHESCPLFPGRTKVVHVGFDDPPRLAREAKTEEEALACYRRVRDEIRAFVEKLPESLASQ
jgi:arsenate reductase (thioredoxin)